MLAYLKRGEAHQRRGDTPDTLTAALRDLRTAAELDPGATRTLEKLGDVNFQLRRYANAAENYEAYLRLDDHAAPIFYKLALASRGDGRLTRAISALQQAVTLNPSFHEAHYVLGLCLKDREQLAEARAAFERASRHRPGVHSRARRARGAAPAAADRRAMKSNSSTRSYALDPNKPERLIAVGRAHLRAGNRDLAVMTLGRAAENFKDHPGVLCRAWPGVARRGGRRAEIRATCAKALEALEPVADAIDGQQRDARACTAARSCWQAGTRRPRRCFRQASQRFPTDPDVLPHFASVAQRLGHLDEARQALVRYSVLVDEDRDEAVHAARIADLSMQLNDAAAAVAWYQKSDALRAGDAVAPGAHGRRTVARRAASSPRARRSTRAIDKDPDHPLVRSVARRLQAR